MSVVVVGSGLAGLTAAQALGDRCVLLTPGALTEGAASMLAQGGFAAALGADDSPALHAEDTWRAGDRAGDRATIERITQAAPGAVADLLAHGVPFDRDAAGALDLHLEAGHQRRRIAHCGDASGAAITGALAEAVRAAGAVVHEHARVTDLVVDAGRVVGVRLGDAADPGDAVIDADAVVLATGGHGALFGHATSPAHAVGAGIALAARAGARTDDLHLVQFHPTALAARPATGEPLSLLTEALRGAGAMLLADGERFVDELRPRDQVAARVWDQVRAGREVWLDARGVAGVRERFARVTRLCAAVGLDPATDLLPVRPAAHYTMGGITVDARCRTGLPGLWAIGETARTGLHGANRLASNSLLEAHVTGRAAASDALGWVRDRARDWGARVAPADPATVVPRRPGTPLARATVRHAMDTGCGVLRDAAGLRATCAALVGAIGCDDAAYVAWLVARSALRHPTSRGAHRRVDSPECSQPILQEVPA